MAVKKLITVPDEILRKKSQPIEKVGQDEKKLIKDLFETMYHHKGIGLAAIQVGIPKKIIVLDVLQKNDKKYPLCFINPIIKNLSSEKSKYESSDSKSHRIRSHRIHTSFIKKFIGQVTFK